MRRRRDFERIHRSGGRHRRGGVTVLVGPGDPGPPKVGVVAGKKVGGAVRRNRAKRRLREALRQARLREGRNYVVIASPRVLEAPFPELVEWLQGAVEDADGG